MKKVILGIFALLMFSISGYAQQKLSLNVNVGYGLSNIISEKLEEVEGNDFRNGGAAILDVIFNYNLFEDEDVLLQVGTGLRNSIASYSLTAADGDPLNFGQNTTYIPIHFTIISKGSSVVSEFVRFGFDPIIAGESYKNNKLIDAKVAGALFGVALGIDVDTGNDGSFNAGIEYSGDYFNNGPISEGFIQIFLGYSFGIF